MSRRGGGKRPGDVNVEMSKFLAYVLRHGANKHGLSMRADGYVLVEELLALDRFKRWDGVTVDTIRHLVAVDSKQRYSLVTEEGQLLIRANQGHSLRGIDETCLLTPVDDPSSITPCIHGTYYAAWDSIKKDGLSKMGRTHIHFARDLPGSSGVISGMRGDCQVHIYLDVSKAMADGITFFVSLNNVILSSGKEGFIGPQYFSKVVDIKAKKTIFPEELAGQQQDYGTLDGTGIHV